MKHFVHILDALTTKRFDGSLTDLHRLSFHSKYRATLSYFFTKSPWEEEVLIHKLQSWILRRLEQQPNERTAPPCLVRSMLPFVSKRSPRHGRSMPFKDVIGTILTPKRSSLGVFPCLAHGSHHDSSVSLCIPSL